MMIGMWTDLGEDSQSSLNWEEIARGILLVGRESKKQIITTRPVNVWPGVWMKIGKAAQKREKQESVIVVFSAFFFGDM